MGCLLYSSHGHEYATRTKTNTERIRIDANACMMTTRMRVAKNPLQLLLEGIRTICKVVLRGSLEFQPGTAFSIQQQYEYISM